MAAYATLSDLYTVMSATQMGSLSTQRQQSILDARNAFADDFLRARYALPIQAPYPESLIFAICRIAAYDCARARGFNPAAGADIVIENDKNEALKWLEDVSRQRVHPAITEATATPEFSPITIGKKLRGW